jgi:hypothetical protein
MRALGGDPWRHCLRWNVNDLATLACKAGKSIVEFKQCLRWGEEAQVLDGGHTSISLALMS